MKRSVSGFFSLFLFLSFYNVVYLNSNAFPMRKKRFFDILKNRLK
ncbi:hypothetical protein D932_02526 [Enterococcus casseliflavus 14-MB-W-14]|nr:hypothetical protein D932_02526 [Enterococcus casseliflavus 14-MB-W-14]